MKETMWGIIIKTKFESFSFFLLHFDNNPFHNSFVISYLYDRYIIYLPLYEQFEAIIALNNTTLN